MAGTRENGASPDWQGSIWRRAMWIAAAGLLLLPAVAMQFTDEMQWDTFDVVVMVILLASACTAIDLVARASVNRACRAGAALATLGIFLLIWINLAVGIIGAETNPANRMFAGVIAVAIGGSMLARFRAAGLARAMQATAAAQFLVAIIAAATGAGTIFASTAGFMALWLGAAFCFRKAAQA